MADSPISPASPLVIVLTTFPEAEQARQIGTALIERQLAACVNLLPGITSIYPWQGQIEESPETLALIKTRRDLLPAVEAALTSLHPYTTPEFVTLAPESASSAYLAWVLASTASEPPMA